MKSLFRFASLSLAIGFSTIQASAQEAASSPAETVPVAEFNEFVKTAKWDEAATWVDNALKVNPNSTKLLALSFGAHEWT